MQAVKEKIQDFKESRKVKAEIKAQEKADKDLAKAKMDIAKEVRLAKEAEAEMDRHVAKAGMIADKEIAKHPPSSNPMDMSSMDVNPMEPGARRSVYKDAESGGSAPTEAGIESSSAMEAKGNDRPTLSTN